MNPGDEWITQLEFDLNRDIRHPDRTKRLQQQDREKFGAHILDPEPSDER